MGSILAGPPHAPASALGARTLGHCPERGAEPAVGGREDGKEAG